MQIQCTERKNILKINIKMNPNVCKHCKHYMRETIIRKDNGDAFNQTAMVNGKRMRLADMWLEDAKPHEIEKDERYCNVTENECPYKLELIVLKND